MQFLWTNHSCLRTRRSRVRNSRLSGFSIAQTRPGPYSMNFPKGLPHFAQGEVVKGFGRGSKDLGIPTANFPVEIVSELPKEVEAGVYFGWASVDKGPVYKMVMSVGWNPFYNNTKKSMETYIIHKFSEDFYGKVLKVVMLGYLRPEKNFNSLDELIKAINDDVKDAEEKLDLAEFAKFKSDEFFSWNN